MILFDVKIVDLGKGILRTDLSNMSEQVRNRLDIS